MAGMRGARVRGVPSGPADRPLRPKLGLLDATAVGVGAIVSAGIFVVTGIAAARPAQWGATTAEQAMIPAARVRSARPDTELRTALEEMDRDGVNQLPVMVDHHAVGILRREDIISFLRASKQLHAGGPPTDYRGGRVGK